MVFVGMNLSFPMERLAFLYEMEETKHPLQTLVKNSCERRTNGQTSSPSPAAVAARPCLPLRQLDASTSGAAAPWPAGCCSSSNLALAAVRGSLMHQPQAPLRIYLDQLTHINLAIAAQAILH